MIPTMPRGFGETLRTLRTEAGLSRRELEDRSGVSQREIAYLEKGRDPRRDTLDALARVLGPQLIEAAFPGHVVAIATRSKDRATGRYPGRPKRPMLEPTRDVAFA